MTGNQKTGILTLAAALLAPPLGVYLHTGNSREQDHFWLNILLTIIHYPLGLAHALWIITHTPPVAGQANEEASR